MSVHRGWRFKKAGGIRLENQKEENQQKKPKEKKKEGRIAKVYRLHQKGVSVKEIAAKMKLSERIVRSYIWIMKNQI
jgi:DNA-binding NarL/FixJ family response regulator